MNIVSGAPASSGVPAQYNLRYIWAISLVAAMGGLLFGYDWVVIGGAKPFFQPFFGIAKDGLVDGVPGIEVNETLSGWANSCALVGCLIGSLVSGMLSESSGARFCC
jgi:MFS family permease